MCWFVWNTGPMGSVTIETTLPAPAAVVWAAVQRTETFVHVAGAVLRCPAVERCPGRWRPGDRIVGWVLLFRFIPISHHTIEIRSVDEAAMELLTEEHGGVIRTWRHYIAVEPIDHGRCRYEDRIELDAGILTPVATYLTRVFFRYRQRRWTRLAALLAAAAETPPTSSWEESQADARLGP